MYFLSWMMLFKQKKEYFPFTKTRFSTALQERTRANFRLSIPKQVKWKSRADGMTTKLPRLASLDLALLE